MKIHLVPNTQMLPDNSDKGFAASVFKRANILQSFYYCDKFTEDIIIPNCKRFMLDSGAFTFFTGGHLSDKQIDDYVEKYIHFIKRNKIELFFELDIEKLAGMEKVEKIRARIERETGRQTIPVWHKERGWDYFERMCAEYDYVAIGGIAKNPNGKTVETVFPHFIKCAHKYGTQIHGLGYTSLKNLPRYHFDSVDSTAWTSGNRFGTVYKFNGSTIVSVKKKEGVRIVDHQKLALHNFIEWCKFADYAETKM